MFCLPVPGSPAGAAFSKPCIQDWSQEHQDVRLLFVLRVREVTVDRGHQCAAVIRSVEIFFQILFLPLVSVLVLHE